MYQPNEISETEKNLSVAIDNLNKSFHLIDEERKKLKNLKDEAITALRDYTSDMVITAANMKKETAASLEKMIQEEERKIDEQSTELQTCLSTAEQNFKDIKKANINDCNQSQQFVCSNIAASTIEKCTALDIRLKCPSIKSIVFSPHYSCHKAFQILKKHKAVGTFFADKKNDDRQHKPYTVRGRYKVQITDETPRSNITGSCYLPDGTTLLTDTSFHCLRRMSLSWYSFTEALEIHGGPHTPWAVCAASKQEAVVTMPELKQVQFVSLGGIMKKVKVWRLDYKCYGVAFNNQTLYISDNYTSIYAYTTEGLLLRTMTLGQSEYSWLSWGTPFWISHISICENGSILYLADVIRGLKAIDAQTGDEVWQFKSKNIKSARGVCVDGLGRVFVCGQNSKNVLLISEKGKKVAEIITSTDGISEPKSVCFHSGQNELVVTGAKSEIEIVILHSD